MRRTLILLGAILFFGLAVPAEAGWRITRLTDQDCVNSYAQISGTNVVWHCSDGNDYEIFLYDGSSVIQLTNNDTGDHDPRVSGSNVVWSGYALHNFHWNDEVFFYNGSSTSRLTHTEVQEYASGVSGTNVVWETHDGYDWEIYFNGEQLTNNNEQDTSSHISGGNVVWQGRDGNDDEIFLYDGSGVIQLTNNDTSDWYPKVSGSNVVWHGWDGHDWEIFLYDGSRVTQLTNNDFDDGGAPGLGGRVSGSNVVWIGQLGGHPNSREIFFYDGEAITRLTHDNESDWWPVVSGSNVAWIQGDQILFYDGATVAQVTNDALHKGWPDISGRNVVWMGWESPSAPVNVYLATWFENSNPEAVGDGYSTNADTPLVVPPPGVLGNDDDPDGDSLTVDSIDNTGTVGVVVNWDPVGSFLYDPDGQFDDLGEGETAEDSFDYTISDGQGGFDSATVTITITGVCHGPCPCTTLLNGLPFKEIRVLENLIGKSVLYRFRDEVMAETAHGNEYIALYYEHAREVAAMLLRSPKLALRSAEMLARLTPKIQAAVDGKASSLSRKDIAAAERLMDLVAAKASPKLQAAIERVRGDLKGGKLNSMFAPMRSTGSVSTVGGG